MRRRRQQRLEQLTFPQRLLNPLPIARLIEPRASREREHVLVVGERNHRAGRMRIPQNIDRQRGRKPNRGDRRQHREDQRLERSIRRLQPAPRANERGNHSDIENDENGQPLQQQRFDAARDNENWCDDKERDAEQRRQDAERTG